METRTDMVIRKTVTVPLPREAAFRLFTEGIATWWPAITHSIAQSADVRAGMDARVGGQIYEESPAGRSPWGTITAWDPPEGFSSTWYPGDGAELATQLTVRFFEERPGATRVELEHRGWEIHGPAAEERFRSYSTGWDPVLAGFGTSAGS